MMPDTKVLEFLGVVDSPADAPPQRLRGHTSRCAEVGHTWPEGGGPCAQCGWRRPEPRCRHGAPLGLSPPHDCEYAEARGALVPYAELAANVDRLVAGIADEVERDAHWDRSFAEHMERLVAVARVIGRKS